MDRIGELRMIPEPRLRTVETERGQRGRQMAERAATNDRQRSVGDNGGETQRVRRDSPRQGRGGGVIRRREGDTEPQRPMTLRQRLEREAGYDDSRVASPAARLRLPPRDPRSSRSRSLNVTVTRGGERRVEAMDIE